MPSSRCCDRIHCAESCVCSSVRMPRNWRSSRSSASIVTFVCSSPFHQPGSACSESSRVDAAIERRGNRRRRRQACRRRSSCRDQLPRRRGDAKRRACAASPLRTAPSIVAGQPVSVHAPARYRPRTPVTGPGPVRGGSRHATERRARLARDEERDDLGARRAAGNRACERGDELGAQLVERSGETVAVGAGERDGQTLPFRQGPTSSCGRTPTAPDVPTPGRERQVGDAAVVDDVQVDDRRRAEPPRVDPRRQRAAGEQLDGVLVRNREDDGIRVERAAPSETATRCPAGTSAETRAFARTSTPAAASARSAASPWSRCSGTRGVADVRRVGPLEQAGLEHLGRERERRVARGRFTVGSVIRSQSASTASAALPVRSRASRRTSARRATGSSSRSLRSASDGRAEPQRGRRTERWP